MKYVEKFLDYNYQFKECPKCSNDEFSDWSHYCKICGNFILNSCTADGNHINPGNARYCEHCGNETTFFRNGLLKPWEEAKKIIEGNDPDTFSTIVDEVDDDDLPF